MDKPDLHELATRTSTLRDALGDLVVALDDAYGAALGEWENEDDDEPIEGTASGDDATYFETARKHANEARRELIAVEELVATVQGYRDFAESGSVPA